MDKHALLMAMGAGRRDWEALLHRIPNTQMMHPLKNGSHWNIKHMIAHIAGYEQYASAMIHDLIEEGVFPGRQTLHLNMLFQRALDKMRDHHPEIPDQVADLDEHQTNELFVIATKHMLPEEVVQYERDAYADLKAAVEMSAEDQLTLPCAALNGQTLIDVLPSQCYAHYRLHMPEMEAWLAHYASVGG